MLREHRHIQMQDHVQNHIQQAEEPPPPCFPFPIASGRAPPPPPPPPPDVFPSPLQAAEAPPPPKKSNTIAGLSAKLYHAVQGCSTFNHVSNPVTVNTGAVKTGTNTGTNAGTTKSTVAPGNPQARGTHLCTCPPTRPSLDVLEQLS